MSERHSVSYLHCEEVQRGLAEQPLALRKIAVRKRANKAINQCRTESADVSNYIGDLSEVSRGRSSRTPDVMVRTW